MTADTQETLNFETEVQQMLNLMIHSLYSNKEVFLRELISNSSDALDKLRFDALSDDSLYAHDGELKIRIAFDKEAKTIAISDNGIGMSHDEVIQHIGTIASSGTKQFIEKLTGDESKDSNLIGQFGVGFYSSFIVADKVTLSTLKAGADSDQGVVWESEGQGTYSIKAADIKQRGTSIILHIKDDCSEFLESYQLRNIIKKFSDHIAWPIIMKSEPTPVDPEDKEAKPEEPKDETVNSASALWRRNSSEIKEEEYQEFYKHVSHDYEEPLTWIHSQVEGKYEYTTLFYIPKKAPFDLWDRERRSGIKLYVRRVFILDDTENLLPQYLRFVKGIVDSADLPLNVSREILQKNKLVESIKSGSVKKILSALKKMAKDEAQYQKFWKEFGKVLKEGPGEDFKNKESIAELFRFSSTHDNVDDEKISLKDYIGRMKEGQDKIYYITAESKQAAKSSPHLEIFKKKEIEVLLLADKVDEWLTSHLSEFEGKNFQSISKGELDLSKFDNEESKEKQKQSEEENKDLVARFKKVLGEQVKDVRISHRLTSSPACLISDQNDMSANLARMLEQAGQGQEVKQILEINPSHAIIEKIDQEQDDEQFNHWTQLIYDQALLSEGGQLKDPAAYVQRINDKLLNLMQ